MRGKKMKKQTIATFLLHTILFLMLTGAQGCSAMMLHAAKRFHDKEKGRYNFLLHLNNAANATDKANIVIEKANTNKKNTVITSSTSPHRK